MIRRSYPGFALGVLAASSGFCVYALMALALQIGRSIGSDSSAIAQLAVAQSLAVAAGVMVLALLVQRRPRRAAVAAVASAAGGATTVAAAFVGGPWLLAGLLAVNAVAVASVLGVHPSLLADAHPPGRRVRAFALHRALQALGGGTAAALVGVLSTSADLTWRGTLLVLGALGLASTAIAIALRDPGVGRFDQAPGHDAELQLSFGEITRGLLRSATVRRLMAAHAALGVMVVPLTVFLLYFLEDRWSLTAVSRGVVVCAFGVVLALALALFAREGDRLLTRGAGALLRDGAIALGAAAGALIVAVALPLFGLSIALLAAALACLGLGQTAMIVGLMSVVAPATRVHAAASAAVAMVGIGGVIGLLVVIDAAREIGTSPGLAILALAGGAAALCVRGASQSADQDAAMTDASVREESEARRIRAAGAATPLLACNQIVVTYGHRRAVDGIDLVIEAGELVVLVGTNGAGKSTLLRVLSGLQPPAAGSVRMNGRDITLLDPERRRALGIGHVAAGAAVFNTLRVDESLRVAAHAAGLGRADAERAMEDALRRFARLGERRTSRVAALSGGERQMLALAQVLVRPPRLLLVDELSLGLAPGAADEVLALVRSIHAQGTTVLVVEQSIDRALELGTRAVFLERGRMQFDGDPEELRGRDDLLRAVFIKDTEDKSNAILPDMQGQG